MQLERLWTPWRAQYVARAAGSRTEECFLCANPRAARDEETYILHRGTQGYILLNLYPYNTGHLMVASYAHTGDLSALDPEAARELWDLVGLAVQALTQTYQPEGFNVGMNLGRAAGAGAPDHLHFHVVPRWVGDTNFMPVTAGAKVLPESLEETYRRLKPLFQR